MVSDYGSRRSTQTTYASPEESKELVRRIGSTRLFAKYERSFTAASGLPLTIRPIGTFRMPASGHKRENPFCHLASSSRKGCLACLQTQAELEKSAEKGPATQRCFAGLSDSLIPIKTGKRIIAYLQTGQVAIGRLKNADFDLVQSELILRGIDLETERAREAYLSSVSLEKENYRGFLKMLQIFADDLGSAANSFQLQNGAKSTNPTVAKAIRYIRKNLDENISLTEIAKTVGASIRHFSKIFKEETGCSFVTYLTKERVERAKIKIRETNDRISDIAFSSGFESLAQFNRSFKKIAGESPSRYRSSCNS